MLKAARQNDFGEESQGARVRFEPLVYMHIYGYRVSLRQLQTELDARLGIRVETRTGADGVRARGHRVAQHRPIVRTVHSGQWVGGERHGLRRHRCLDGQDGLERPQADVLPDVHMAADSGRPVREVAAQGQARAIGDVLGRQRRPVAQPSVHSAQKVAGRVGHGVGRVGLVEVGMSLGRGGQQQVPVQVEYFCPRLRADRLDDGAAQ